MCRRSRRRLAKLVAETQGVESSDHTTAGLRQGRSLDKELCKHQIRLALLAPAKELIGRGWRERIVSNGHRVLFWFSSREHHEELCHQVMVGQQLIHSREKQIGVRRWQEMRVNVDGLH